MFNFLKKRKKDFFSQSGQDQFAYNLSGDNGFYLEIGAHHPIINSNSYNLEVSCNWKGISIEYDLSYKNNWEKCIERKNPILWNDAFEINYNNLKDEYSLPNRISYLSCDIEPPKNTFNILTKIINEGLEFDFISYEHDKYNSGNKYELLSENFLLSQNYKIAIKDVYSRSKKHKIYETWFTNKDIDFENISYDDWKKTRYKKNRFIR